MINEETISNLNNLAKEAKLNNIETNAIYYLPWGDKTNVLTVLDSKIEPTQTYPAMYAGFSIPYTSKGVTQVPSDFKGIVGVHSSLLGYAMVKKLLIPNHMRDSLEHCIKCAIMDLTNQFGTLDSKYNITMELPNLPGEYFIDHPKLGALVVRFTLKKVS